jgi:hypothetical protein
MFVGTWLCEISSFRARSSYILLFAIFSSSLSSRRYALVHIHLDKCIGKCLFLSLSICINITFTHMLWTFHFTIHLFLEVSTLDTNSTPAYTNLGDIDSENFTSLCCIIRGEISTITMVHIWYNLWLNFLSKLIKLMNLYLFWTMLTTIWFYRYIVILCRLGSLCLF